MALYKIVDERDGSDVLGRPVEYENPAISIYAVPLKGQPTVASLKIGESTRVQGGLSLRPKANGPRARQETYRIHRVE